MTIPPECNQKITDSGDLTPENWDGITHRCHLFTAGELRQLARQVNLQLEAISAANCISINQENVLSEIDENSPQWKELLRMELEACADEGCLKYGNPHSLCGKEVEWSSSSVLPGIASAEPGLFARALRGTKLELHATFFARALRGTKLELHATFLALW